MKKLNSKGFTLIELLAVITIMGILMLVAIPTVSRTIENSRKDTFLDTTKQYVNSAKNMWAADNFKCGGYSSSAVEDGVYYINVDSSASSTAPVLLEQGGKSSWGSRDIKGYIRVTVDGTSGTRRVSYVPFLTDNVHGVNVVAAASGASYSTAVADEDMVESDKLVRGNLVMSGAKYLQALDAAEVTICVEQ